MPITSFFNTLFLTQDTAYPDIRSAFRAGTEAWDTFRDVITEKMEQTNVPEENRQILQTRIQEALKICLRDVRGTIPTEKNIQDLATLVTGICNDMIEKAGGTLPSPAPV